MLPHAATAQAAKQAPQKKKTVKFMDSDDDDSEDDFKPPKKKPEPKKAPATAPPSGPPAPKFDNPPKVKAPEPSPIDRASENVRETVPK